MRLKPDYVARRLFAPSSWRIGVRRVFVLTLPVAVAVWVLLVLGVALVLMARGLWEPISAFWNDPPQRLNASNYNKYGARPAPMRNLIELDEARKQRDAA